MHTPRSLALLICASLMAATPVVARSASAADVTVVDAGGRSVSVADASRILSIGGDVTEIVYALGAGDRVVGVDTTSQYPPQALKEKKSVGYMRALSSEGVISVGASLVLASERSGPPEVMKTLKATTVPLVEVADDNTPDGLTRKIRLIARAIGVQDTGETLTQKVSRGFATLVERRARIKSPVRALFVLGVQNGRVLAGGKNTSADAMLQLAGAINVASGANGFRALTDEAIVELAPEVIVAMRRSSTSDAHDLSQLFDLKGIQGTPAGKNRRIVTMDGLYLLGFGPRAPDAASDLMALLYPELTAKGGNATR